jgi:aminomethyltransferase
LEKKTPLYQEHVQAAARMMPFAGFSMPVQYAGILSEHRAVRQRMGLFDLSHMGEFRITGPAALDDVDRLVTNKVRDLDVGQIRYSPMCYPDGGIVEDLLVYRFPDSIMLVVNAANIDKDLVWVRDQLSNNTYVEDISDSVALIALQGPTSASFLQGLTDTDLAVLPYYHFATGKVADVDATISRTGYTGEDGFELYVRPDDAVELWRILLQSGEPLGLQPVGLGARDTLRLEAGYMLYGNDIDADTTPLEAGLSWTVKFDERDFIGRNALARQKAEGVRRRMVAVEMLDRAVPRPHCLIRSGEEDLGSLTSGSFSPTFGKGIGLGYVRVDQARPGTEVQIEIRQQEHPAKLVRKPMYRREDARA